MKKNDTLSTESLISLANAINEIAKRESLTDKRDDIVYIKKIKTLVLAFEITGRVLIFFPMNIFLVSSGILFLSVAKIIENTEIGHNVMHGQYDDDRAGINGNTYEFDAVATSKNWRKSHNDNHHSNTGVIGLDNDVSILRFAKTQTWKPYHLFQPAIALISALFAQWAVAVQNLQVGDVVTGKIKPKYFLRERLQPLLKKSLWKISKDYLIFPALALHNFFYVFLANLTANMMRNVWVWFVICAGHCASGIRLYTQEEISNLPEEHWYIRQITSSANFSAGPILRVLTGHLGYHIEHHLFPTIASRRLPKIAEEVEAICKAHGLHYNNMCFANRLVEVLKKLIRYSFP